MHFLGAAELKDVMAIVHMFHQSGRGGKRLLQCLAWLWAWVMIPSATVVSADEAQAVRLAGSSWVHDAPTRIAHLSGYFAGPGPDIVIEEEVSGKASLSRLQAGEADFALVAATPVAHALLQQTAGVPQADDIVVLATISSSSQTHHVLGVRDRGIHRPSDLRGRHIGMLMDSSAEFYWTQFALLHGLEPGAVHLQNTPIESMAAQLREGTVDAVVIWDPWVFRIERDLQQATVRFSDRQIYTLNWLLVTHRETEEQMPEVCDRLLTAYLRAVQVLHRYPERARELHGYDSDLPDDYLRTLDDRVIFHMGLQWSVLMDIEQQLDWLLAKQGVDPIARPRPEWYLAPGPMRRVAPHRLLMLDIWDDAAQETVQ